MRTAMPSRCPQHRVPNACSGSQNESATRDLARAVGRYSFSWTYQCERGGWHIGQAA